MVLTNYFTTSYRSVNVNFTRFIFYNIAKNNEKFVQFFKSGQNCTSPKGLVQFGVFEELTTITSLLTRKIYMEKMPL